jgi:trimeric autotransporter adhesin
MVPMFFRKLVISLVICGCCVAAFSQTPGPFVSNTPLTSAALNSAFAGKVDWGATISTSSAAGNVAVGTAYSALTNNASNLNNTALGIGALAASTNQPNNTAIGAQALNALTTNGANETAVGRKALLSDTSGTFNTSVGSDSARYLTTASGNTALGHGALGGDDTTPANLTNNYNTGVGGWSMQELTTGSSNTAVGMNSGLDLTTGQQNVFVGQGAGACTTNNLATNIGCAASFNVAIGYNSLQKNTADQETAVGYLALNSNTTGSLNTAVGYAALQNAATDVRSTALGYLALQTQNGANDNTAIGSSALQAVTTGSQNTALGSSAGSAITNLTNTTAIGYQAAPAASNTIQLGNSSVLTTNSTAYTSGLGLVSTTGFGPSTNRGTGVYFPTLNQVALAGNGTQGLLVVGSGLTTAQVGLVVAGAQSFGASEAAIGGSAANGGLYGGQGTNFDTTITDRNVAHAIEVITGGTMNFPNIANNTGAQTGAVCRGTAGLITYDNTNTCLVSDADLKDIEGPVNRCLEKVEAINSIRFHYKDLAASPDEHAGFTAQNVAEVDPLFAAMDERGKPIKVRYVEMAALWNCAIQEQQQKIAKLETMIQAIMVRIKD